MVHRFTVFPVDRCLWRYHSFIHSLMITLYLVTTEYYSQPYMTTRPSGNSSIHVSAAPVWFMWDTFFDKFTASILSGMISEGGTCINEGLVHRPWGHDPYLLIEKLRLNCIGNLESKFNLNMPSVADRIRRGDVIETFKIFSGLVNIESDQFFARNQDNRNHHMHIY